MTTSSPLVAEHHPRLARSMVGFAAMTVLSLLLARATAAHAGCVERPALQNFTGAGRVTCPCFVRGEEAGAVFQAPVGDYPIEILRVGIGWGSQFGGTGQSLQKAIHVYAGGLPDPGPPIFTLDGPVLGDGAINQFDFEPLPGSVVVGSGPFAVTLEFLSDNAGDVFAPSVVHDGNGCQPGRNLVNAGPGTWTDACDLGVSGDWVFFVIYQACSLTAGIDTPAVLATTPAFLASARPNPFRGATAIEFVLARAGRASLSVRDVAGRRVATLADDWFGAGAHEVQWNGLTAAGQRARAGVYYLELCAGGVCTSRTVLLRE